MLLTISLQAIEALAEAKLEADKQQKLREGFERAASSLPAEDRAEVAAGSQAATRKLPKLAATNPHFPAFSDAVEIRRLPGGVYCYGDERQCLTDPV